MKWFNRLKKKIWTDETKKILRYIWKPTWITFLTGIALILIVLIVLNATGYFESFIVSTDLKYNSPLFKWLIGIFALAEIFIVIYGVSLCLYKYKRPGGKGIKHHYSSGNSYKALASELHIKES